MSKRSLQRLLRAKGFSSNVSKKKSILSKEKAKKRLKYAKERLSKLTNNNFSKIIFSNKLAIQRGHRSRTEYYQKRGNNKTSKELVSISNRG